MTAPSLSAWQPVTRKELPARLGHFRDWFLCGGESVDHFVGRTTRAHGDIDVGVYRSELMACLRSVHGIPYLCDPPGSVVRWQGGDVPQHVNDIFVADHAETHWMFQILVFTDRGDRVVFKRNDSITWAKSAHVIEENGFSILNPAITLLYKTTNGRNEPKDLQDIVTLIESCAERLGHSAS
ncbi:MAG: hypothetical protein AAF525_12630 [Pseudomonadota bacterium]